MNILRVTWKWLRRLLLVLLAVVAIGFVLPDAQKIPVKGATSADWNHQTFWYHPWGRSGVHKGIDIFAKLGTPVISSSGGVVVFTGNVQLGGNVVLALGPKWRLHYYAHLDLTAVKKGDWLSAGEHVGRVGDTGNAAGKSPHLHYSVFSLIPYPWLWSTEPQGWKKMFFLNPHEMLIDSGTS